MVRFLGAPLPDEGRAEDVFPVVVDDVDTPWTELGPADGELSRRGNAGKFDGLLDCIRSCDKCKDDNDDDCESIVVGAVISISPDVDPPTNAFGFAGSALDINTNFPFFLPLPFFWLGVIVRVGTPAEVAVDCGREGNDCSRSKT